MFSGRDPRRPAYSEAWPTPTASDANGSGSAGYGTESGRSEGTTLTDAVVRGYRTNPVVAPSTNGRPVRPTQKAGRATSSDTQGELPL